VASSAQSASSDKILTLACREIISQKYGVLQNQDYMVPVLYNSPQVKQSDAVMAMAQPT